MTTARTDVTVTTVMASVDALEPHARAYDGLAVETSRLGPVIGKAGVPGEPYRFLYAGDELDAVLPGLVRLHVRRNEDLDRAALLRIPRQRDLFMDTVTGHADGRRVRLLLTTIDDRLAAFALCLVSGSRWWVYANYADPEFLRYSPGTVTNAEVVRTAYADPAVTVLDWGAGLQRYKLSGGADVTIRQALVAESSLLVRALRAAARRVRRG